MYTKQVARRHSLPRRYAIWNSSCMCKHSTLQSRHGYSLAHSTDCKCAATHTMAPVSSFDSYRAIYETASSWLDTRDVRLPLVQFPNVSKQCTAFIFMHKLITFWGAKSTIGMRNFNLRRGRVIKRVNIGLNQSFTYIRTPPSATHPQVTPMTSTVGKFFDTSGNTNP